MACNLVAFTYIELLAHNATANDGQGGVLQVFSACAMSFVHGANDVANAMGPLSGVYQIWQTGQISSNVSVQS